MKRCTRCGEHKPLEAFGTHKEGAHGRRPECKECQRARERERRKANPELMRAKDRERSVRERDRRTTNATRWARANPDSRKASRAKWLSQNLDAHASAEAKRRASRLTAIPPWAEPEKTSAVYAQAAELRALGVDVHVDHIVPLQGETVSGLHWHGNLEILLARDNIAKGAKLLDSVSPLAE